MREVPLSLNSQEFLSSVLKEGLRPDARGGYDYRDIKINFGPQWGHAEVCETAWEQLSTQFSGCNFRIRLLYFVILLMMFITTLPLLIDHVDKYGSIYHRFC